MGYCYDTNNRLCCDECGQAGGVLKRRCPFGWCPPAAVCDTCWKKTTKKGVKFHRELGCEKKSREYDATNARKDAMLKAGHYVRCSAMSVGNERVQVLFDNQHGDTIGRFMSSAVSAAGPNLEPATPESYMVFGPIEDAPSNWVR